MNAWSRREWLALCAASAVAQTGNEKIRIGFIGVGSRGTALLKNLLTRADTSVPAICDIDPANLKRAQDLVKEFKGEVPAAFGNGPGDYRRLLARDDVQAVLIATPQEDHARMSIDAMNAGKFAVSEVPACTTLEECWELVRTHRKTKSGYMLLENYRYNEPVMQVANMAAKGLFGELTYAECCYIHEIRDMRFNKDGSLTWRGENVRKNIGDIYPTHSVGPVCGWMGVNRTDRLVSLVTMASKPAALQEYAARRFGKDSPQAKIKFQNGDTNNTLIRTALGRLIAVRYDTASPRPAGMGQYSLQGTRGSYLSAFGEHKVYIEGRGKPHTWEPLDAYRSEYQHPYWAQRGGEARKSGHGGGDYFVLADMIDAVRTGVSPIDVYDAATWSSIRPLSALSLERGSAPVDIPDFKG